MSGSASIFQPKAKLEFVRRYCNPRDGWIVFVDIDASEEGRTGGERKTPESRERQVAMKKSAKEVREEFDVLNVQVGGKRREWSEKIGVAIDLGDRDIVAVNKESKLMVIAEVEAESGGQAEQKLAKAIGQIVIAAGTEPTDGFDRELVLVVAGESMTKRLPGYLILEQIGVSAVAIGHEKKDDRRAFGEASCVSKVKASKSRRP